VFSFDLQPTLGTELAFTTLPAAFSAMSIGRVVAVAFFELLFFAALSSGVALLEVGVAAATNTTRLGRSRATGLLTAGVFVAGVPSALSYSPVRLLVFGTPVLDVVDESVGTYALPVSAFFIAVVFVWIADLGTVHDELGRLRPLVKFGIPPALAVVTLARALGVARPAWRLLIERPRDELVAVLVTGLAFAFLLSLGWLLRSRLSYPGRRRRR
jgi:NSS family neurotransmitter:Na+ symporter